MRDVIVVGAGIIGATIAKALEKQGRDVLLLDSGKAMAGTPPSGGHLKPGWLGGISKPDAEAAMKLLDDTWGLITEEFTVRPTILKTTVYRVDTDRVLEFPRTVGKVSSLHNLETIAPTVVGDNLEERCRLLVVAAGVWCAELLPECFSKGSLQAKQGISFRIPGHVNPFIKVWAPYKQVVAHQQSENEIWVGDGTAILQKNWTDLHAAKCESRCRRTLGTINLPTRSIMGLRPYFKTKDPCLFKQLGPRTYVVTGASKMGTIAAGWSARRILDATS